METDEPALAFVVCGDQLEVVDKFKYLDGFKYI